MIKAQRTTSFKSRLFLGVATFSILASSFLPTKAYAEGLALKITPSTIKIKAQTPSDLRAPFIIENQSDQSIRLKLAYKLFDPTLSQEGKVSYIDNPGSANDIFNYVYVVDTDNARVNSLDLGPKQQKQLQLRVQLPQNQASRDYYFSLIFFHDVTQQTDQNSTISDKKDQHTITTIQGGLGANVLLAVGNQETAQGYIEDFSTPWYKQSGPVPFAIKVKNTGIHYIAPKGNILIKNIFGQAVGRVDIPETPILAGTSRSLFDETQIARTIQETTEPKVEWKENFLFGIYSAQINLAMSEDGPINSQTIRFMVFPTHLLLGLIFIIALAILIYKRVKKKLR